jgi:hypothetical protein
MEQRHIFEWGSQLYNGLLFDKTSESEAKFNQFRTLKVQQFIPPSKIDKNNLRAICVWIEGMYKAMLMKWRKPISSSSAQDMISSAQLPTHDFSGLGTLLDNIRQYVKYVDSTFSGQVDEDMILQYVLRALQLTDRTFKITRGNPLSLENQFPMGCKFINFNKLCNNNYSNVTMHLFSCKT